PLYTVALLSFPTRRSSDLSLGVTLDNPARAHLLVRANGAAKAKELAAGLQKDPAHWLSLPSSDFVLSAQTPKVDQKNENLELRLDRKSTRLNSSHVSISYA